jgi:hypothetical protein
MNAASAQRAQNIRNLVLSQPGALKVKHLWYFGIIIGVFWLASSLVGFIGVQSNLKNKCKDNTFGVDIATNLPSKYFMISMIVLSIIMILGSFAGMHL